MISEVKAKARESLKGHYTDAIILLVIFSVISGLISAAPTWFLSEDAAASVSAILSFVFTCTVTFGFVDFFLKISRGEEASWKDLFSRVDLFIPFFIISFLVGIFTFLWSLLFIIPGIIAAIGYSQVYRIKLDNPDISAMDAIKKSKEIMSGHKMDWFLLMLSFFGWIILGIFTLGILYFWLIPYMEVAEANFYNKIIEEKK